MFICQHIATPPVLQCVKYDLHMHVYRSANLNVSFAPERVYTEFTPERGERTIPFTSWGNEMKFTEKIEKELIYNNNKIYSIN